MLVFLGSIAVTIVGKAQGNGIRVNIQQESASRTRGLLKK